MMTQHKVGVLWLGEGLPTSNDESKRKRSNTDSTAGTSSTTNKDEPEHSNSDSTMKQSEGSHSKRNMVSWKSFSRRSKQPEISSDIDSNDTEVKVSRSRRMLFDELRSSQREWRFGKPRGGRMLHTISKQASVRDLTMFAGVVDGSTGRELTLEETHELIPGMLGFKSALALINKERVLQGRERLKRSVYLDRLCQEHAKTMASAGAGGKSGKMIHSVPSTAELKELVNSDEAGENIQRGSSVEAMHREIMTKRPKPSAAYKNVMSEKFVEFGMGTARGKDGKLYMVQLFRGKLKNTLEAKEGDLSNSILVTQFLEQASFWTH